MASERTSRQTLAELALAVLPCGLLAGLFLSPHRSSDEAIILVGLPTAITTWLLIRNRRTWRACEGLRATVRSTEDAVFEAKVYALWPRAGGP